MVFGVAYSPDGRQIAAASSDGAVSQWDAVQGKQTLSLPAHVAAIAAGIRPGSGNFVYAVAYRPDGKQIAAASSDGIVRVWDLAPGE